MSAQASSSLPPAWQKAEVLGTIAGSILRYHELVDTGATPEVGVRR